MSILAIGLGLFIMYLLFILGGQLLVGLAVYHDAKARHVDMATIWGVLTGFFGWLPAVIYLAIRPGTAVPQSEKCPRCSARIFEGMPACPACGLPSSMVPALDPAQIARHHKLAKRCLIFGVIMIVLCILSAAALTFVPALAISDYPQVYY